MEGLTRNTVICAQCGATLATYADQCEAGLTEWCPGDEWLRTHRTTRAQDPEAPDPPDDP